VTLRIIIIVAVLVAAVLAFAATKPKTVHVQRSISIKAPPTKIFALIDNFQNWGVWAHVRWKISTYWPHHRTVACYGFLGK
jgi:hypothetical protein